MSGQPLFIPGGWFNAKSKWFWIRLTLSVVVLLIAVIFFMFSGGKSIATYPNRFLIPTRYTGWIIIEFDVKGAPPTPIVGGYKVYKVPSNGQKRSGIMFTYLKTSSPSQTGEEIDQYYYTTSKGLLSLPESSASRDNQVSGIAVWGSGAYSGGDGIPESEHFFVGTKSEYDTAESGPEPRAEEEEARDKLIGKSK